MPFVNCAGDYRSHLCSSRANCCAQLARDFGVRVSLIHQIQFLHTLPPQRMHQMRRDRAIGFWKESNRQLVVWIRFDLANLAHATNPHHWLLSRECPHLDLTTLERFPTTKNSFLMTNNFARISCHTHFSNKMPGFLCAIMTFFKKECPANASAVLHLFPDDRCHA